MRLQYICVINVSAKSNIFKAKAIATNRVVFHINADVCCKTFNKICNIVLNNFYKYSISYTQNERNILHMQTESQRQRNRQRGKSKRRTNEWMTTTKKCHERSMFIFCLTLARFLCMAGLFSVGLNWTHDVCWCHAASDFDECEICVWKLPTSLSLSSFFLFVLRFSLSHIIHSFALSVRLSSRCYYEHN